MYVQWNHLRLVHENEKETFLRLKKKNFKKLNKFTYYIFLYTRSTIYLIIHQGFSLVSDG